MFSHKERSVYSTESKEKASTGVNKGQKAGGLLAPSASDRKHGRTYFLRQEKSRK